MSLDDSDLQKLLAAVMELAPVKWIEAQMEKEQAKVSPRQAAAVPSEERALATADAESNRYRRVRDIADYNANRGVHQTSAEVELEVARATSPARYARRQMPSTVLDQAVRARHEMNLKTGRHQRYADIVHDIQCGR